MGVLSSCDTFARNSFRISSISSFFSISRSNSLFAVFSSDMVFSSVFDKSLICSPSKSISFCPRLLYFDSKFKCIICSEISFNSIIGLVILVVKNQISTALTAVAAIPTYAKKRFDTLTLSRILSSGDCIRKRFPLSSIPHISKYSVAVDSSKDAAR